MFKKQYGKTYKKAIVVYYEIFEDRKKVKQKLISSLNTVHISGIFLQTIKENL